MKNKLVRLYFSITEKNKDITECVGFGDLRISSKDIDYCLKKATQFITDLEKELVERIGWCPIFKALDRRCSECSRSRYDRCVRGDYDGGEW